MIEASDGGSCLAVAALATRTRGLAVCAVALLLLGAPAVTAQDRVVRDADQDAGGISSFVDVMRPVVRAARLGRLEEHEKPFVFRPDFLKGVDGRTYVPYTLTIDGGRISSPAPTLYVCVTERSDGTATGPAESPAGAPGCVFEDAYSAEVNPQSAAPVYLNRAFELRAGDYDAYVAIRDDGRRPGAGQDVSPARVMLLRERLVVPDLWAPELRISSVLVGNVESLDSPLTAERQLLEPYTIGTFRVAPRRRLTYRPAEDLSFLYFVYGAGPTGGAKPNLTIEYRFHRRIAGTEVYFTRTRPERLNARTMAPEFDMTQGHEVAGGHAVPLASFSAGDYRLEIRVTDNTSGAFASRDVVFTVRAR